MELTREQLWQQGQLWYRQGWMDAAREALETTFNRCSEIPLMRAQAADLLGRIAVRENRFTTGSNWFRWGLKALDTEADNALAFAMQVRLYMAMAADGHVDRAIRSMQQLEPYAAMRTARQQAIFHMNFAVMYMQNEFYPQALARLTKTESLLFFQEDMADLGYALHTNLGVVLIELSQWSQAQDQLRKALTFTTGHSIHAINELTRVAHLTGDDDLAYQFATQAMHGMWGTLMTFEKSELAHLCEILARLANHWGAASLKSQLLDTSQTLYGQLGMWRQWRRLQVDTDLTSQQKGVPMTPFVTEVARFAQLLQAMLAQDILDPKFPPLADVRTQIAQALAEQAQWNPESREHLNLVCRLADYGLTAIDYEVVKNPHQSSAAWARYQQHPTLSIRLLQSLHLPLAVINGIMDHHEQPNSNGFPEGKSEARISEIALVFAVAHAYAWQVIYLGIKHTQALDEVQNQAGIALAQAWVERLVSLFRPGTAMRPLNP